MTETPQPDPHVGTEQPAYQQPAYQQAPNPYAANGDPYAVHGFSAEVSQTDRNWASASHWGTLVAAWLAMGFIAPLVIMFTVGSSSAFVRKHAVESLNFQISVLIYAAAALLFSVLTIGLGLIIVVPLGLVAFVFGLIFLIQGSIRAANGQDFRYPLTLRFVS